MNLNNRSRIQITIDGANSEAIINSLREVGVNVTSVSGNTVSGEADNNLVGPLRTIAGVTDVKVTQVFGDPSVSSTPQPNPVFQGVTTPSVTSDLQPGAPGNPVT